MHANPASPIGSWSAARPWGSAVMPQVINHPSTHSSSRNGAPVRAICLHHTGGTDSLKWLTKNPEQVSTHVLIAKNGTIYRMVPDERAANAVGRSNLGIYSYQDGDPDSANQYTLSIEIENWGNGKDEYTSEQYRAVGWQICQWWNKYGDLCVITHELIDTKGKRDPYAFDVIRALRCALAEYDH